MLQQAIADSTANALVIDESVYGTFEAAALNLPSLTSRFVVRDLRPSARGGIAKDFWSEVGKASSTFDAVDNDTSSAAFIFYFESTNKHIGIVHSHRSILGQLAAFEMFNEIEDHSDAVFWTAGDWSSPAAALGMLYPALWYGCSVVAGEFDNRASTLRLMRQCEVTNVFMPASLPKAIDGSEPEPGEAANLKIRTIVTEGSLWPAYLVSSDPGKTVNLVYGKPETGWVFGNCKRWFPAAAGAYGRPAPGRSIEIIDEERQRSPAGSSRPHRSSQL